MANEAKLKRWSEYPYDMTVADGTGIEKGAVLKATDNNTAAAADGTNDIVAGIAAREKIASDGRTQLSVYKKGRFHMYLSGSCSTGDTLGTIATYTNYVTSNVNTPNLSGNKIIGTAVEDGTDNTQILVDVNILPGAGSNGA